MIDYSIRDILFFLLTILLAMILTIIPLPSSMLCWRPSWVLLVIVFWFCVAPEMVGLTCFWCIGLFQDLLMSTPLGMHAVIYVVVGFCLSRMSSRLSQYPQWQQLTVIFIISMFQVLFTYVSMNMANQPIRIMVLLPVMMVNCLVWHWLFKAMYVVWRRRLRLY